MNISKTEYSHILRTYYTPGLIVSFSSAPWHLLPILEYNQSQGFYVDYLTLI